MLQQTKPKIVVSIKELFSPNKLKCVDVSALYKKGDKTTKDNYRPISILPTIIHLFGCITNYLFPLFCGFRKSFSTQHAPSCLLENWKLSLDSGGQVGVFL